MKTYTREDEYKARAAAAHRRGKFDQEWFIWAEAAHETNSPTRQAFYDRQMRRVESARRDSPRYMRNKAGGMHP